MASRPPRSPGALPARENRELRALHPLVLFEAASGLVYFLNARLGRRTIEYLSYESGDTLRREELGAEHPDLLARVLGQSVWPAQAEPGAATSMAEDPASKTVSSETAARRIGEF